MKMPDPHVLSSILVGGGEAFVVASDGSTHFVSVDEDGGVTEHLRYEGEPEAVVKSLVGWFYSTGDLDAHNDFGVPDNGVHLL